MRLDHFLLVRICRQKLSHFKHILALYATFGMTNVVDVVISSLLISRLTTYECLYIDAVLHIICFCVSIVSDMLFELRCLPAIVLCPLYLFFTSL